MLNYLISFEAFQINFLHLDLKHFENSFHKPRFDSNDVQSFHKHSNDAIMSQYTIHFNRAYIHRRKIEFKFPAMFRHGKKLLSHCTSASGETMQLAGKR